VKRFPTFEPHPWPQALKDAIEQVTYSAVAILEARCQVAYTLTTPAERGRLIRVTIPTTEPFEDALACDVSDLVQPEPEWLGLLG
jgi:hypothetical protein